jgi:hypothetical protein
VSQTVNPAGSPKVTHLQITPTPDKDAKAGRTDFDRDGDVSNRVGRVTNDKVSRHRRIT